MNISEGKLVSSVSLWYVKSPVLAQFESLDVDCSNDIEKAMSNQSVPNRLNQFSPTECLARKTCGRVTYPGTMI